MPFGLPDLPPNIQAGISFGTALAAAATPLAPQVRPVWGLFKSGGVPALTGYRSCLGFQFTQDFRLPTHPIEQGGFATYNKVRLPYMPRLNYTVIGGQNAIGAFLTQVAALVGDTNLYTLVTPYLTRNNANAYHFDYTQTAQHGVSMLSVDIWVSEVRPANTAFAPTPGQQQGTQASPTATKTPDGQAQQAGGVVQPQTPSVPPGQPDPRWNSYIQAQQQWQNSNPFAAAKQ